MKRTIKRNGEIQITMDFNTYSEIRSILYRVKIQYENVKENTANGFETENYKWKEIRLLNTIEEFEKISEIYEQLEN